MDLTDDYINAVIGQGRHDNQSFFAFTATPKGQTLESFGTVVGVTAEGEPIKAPFHVYSMRQAIEEKYILDVLANYTTVKEAFKLIRVSEDNPELIEGPAARALFKYYKKHGYTIAFMPHPNIITKIDLFTKNKDVKFYTVDDEYRDVYASSNLVLTDYSSAVFDFAYLRKPLIYATVRYWAKSYCSLSQYCSQEYCSSCLTLWIWSLWDVSAEVHHLRLSALPVR